MQIISSTPLQRNSPNRHTAQAREVTPGADRCEECLATGDVRVRPRVCLSCGHVGPCDSPKHKHATTNFRATRGAVVRSLEPGETRAYCYEEQTLL